MSSSEVASDAAAPTSPTSLEQVAGSPSPVSGVNHRVSSVSFDVPTPPSSEVSSKRRVSSMRFGGTDGADVKQNKHEPKLRRAKTMVNGRPDPERYFRCK